jgi:two-component system NtrC family response regulator
VRPTHPLLVVEDDPGLRAQLRWTFDDREVLFAGSREEALARLRAHEPDVVLLDLGLPPRPEGVEEGLATLEQVLELLPHIKVVVLTGREGREHAIRAVGAGAWDYLGKPADPERLRFVIDRAFHVARLEAENRALLEARALTRLPGLIGDSPAILRVCRLVEKVAATDIAIVLEGESGTGKEVVARAIHASGPRAPGPFVAINCAAIPANLLEAELFGYERGAFTGATRRQIGRIERAHGGTLFLDEIGDMPPELQAKLLRFLQEREIERLGGGEPVPVDVRVVAATHRDLRARIAEGAFREDLYYRLAEMRIDIPPLRERPGDAVLLANHFLRLFARELSRRVTGFTPDAAAAIDAYEWPGNVRELQNRVKRAVVVAEGRRVTREDLGLDPADGAPGLLNLRRVRERAELEAVRRALARAQGNISRAARLLGVSRPTLYDLLRQHQLRD